MEYILFLFVAIPLLGFLVNIFVPSRNELLLSQVAFSAMGLQFILVLLFSIYWLSQGAPVLTSQEILLYQSPIYRFYIQFAYNSTTAVFLMVGALLAFLITVYSKTYLHRERGYKRFFNTITLFYMGYNWIVLSGNMVMLFIGWEISGIASFLLIAFYRNRYIPVKNAVKIFSVYRIGDVALILALWVEHHLWHENIAFSVMQNNQLDLQIIHDHHYLPYIFVALIFIAASIKSAQVPFASWLSRAMEGPTPSSAIFYGSLSVHIGVLLLMKTYAFWQHLPIVYYFISFCGLITYALASSIARIQPSIKGQIAYSSIAQIGLMFIEVAWGLHGLALIHFAGNAFLRSYQLLLSPSVVTYLIREQFYRFNPQPAQTSSVGFLRKLRNSIYILNLREWYMDDFMHHSIWNFLKRLGRIFHVISTKVALFSAAFLFFVVLGVSWYAQNFSDDFFWYFALLISSAALAFGLWAFTEKHNVFWALLMLGFSHFFVLMAVSLLDHVQTAHIWLYLSGIIISLALGAWALFKLQKREWRIHLHGYQGHCYEHTDLELLFLLAALGLIGFPITPAFLGIEILFTYIHSQQIVLLIIFATNLLVWGLAMMRMYARIFLGPHVKTYHEVARKTS